MLFPKSRDERVQGFLDELRELDTGKYELVQRLREIVLFANPDVEERMMYGGIMFSLEDDFGGVFVSRGHVSFEFGEGFKLDDPRGLLEGSGKYRRHLKMTSPDDVENKNVESFVTQALQIRERYPGA